MSVLGKALVAKVGQRRPSPERQRLHQLALLLQTPEAVEIQLVLAHLQQVTRRPGLYPLLPEQLAQPRDVDLERFLCRLRRVVLPQRVDQPVIRDNVVGIEEQHGEQGALLGTAEIDGLPIRKHLQRAEDPELHSPPGLCRRESATLSARAASA